MQKYEPGKSYHKLTILERASPPENHGYARSKFWRCACECGNEVVRSSTYLKTVKFPSCGCDTKRCQITHGMSDSPEFSVWLGVISRCYNKNNSAYHNYGGRGITVCDEWLHSFESFYEDMGSRPAKYELDRVDNSKGYSKDNCRWASKSENLRNTRRNVMVDYNGKTYVLTDLARLLGINPNALSRRIKKGIRIDKPIGRWK